MPSTFDESLEGAMDKLGVKRAARRPSIRPSKAYFSQGIRVNVADWPLHWKAEIGSNEDLSRFCQKVSYGMGVLGWAHHRRPSLLLPSYHTSNRPDRILHAMHQTGPLGLHSIQSRKIVPKNVPSF